MNATAIIPAAGTGVRMGRSRPKQFLDLCGRPILAHTLKVFEHCAEIDRVIVVTAPEWVDFCSERIVRRYGLRKIDGIVAGGAERQDSVYAGLKTVDDAEIIVIHDAVRPFVEPSKVAESIERCEETGAVIVAVPPKDTIKVGDGGMVQETLDRRCLWSVQTPQTFSREVLRTAYDRAFRDNVYGTDDAGLVERTGHPVHILLGSYENLKITTLEDLEIAETMLRRRAGGRPEVRVGQGYDVHRLLEGRPLILGGVHIPFDRGLLGHSDADVLCHAVADALLGAVAGGDIGVHFPDTDPQFEGISSLILLTKVAEIVRGRTGEILNVDSTILAQEPKLASLLPEMRRNIARALTVDGDRVSIKATTTEELGFVGRREGIAAQAVVSVNVGVLRR